MAAIVNNRIEGTRITVWDITHYLEHGRSAEYIAEVLRLSREQVEAALRYIDENKEAVWAVHRKIEERIAKGNPPETEEILAATRARMDAWLKARKESLAMEANSAGRPC